MKSNLILYCRAARHLMLDTMSGPVTLVWLFKMYFKAPPVF